MGVADDYDELAGTYATQLGAELDGKPLDRALLRAFAEQVGDGVVADVGCGPGHVTAFLAACGLDTVGIDLSPGMIAQARRRWPELPFTVGSVLDLYVPDDAWAGAVALYSLIHLDGDELRVALTELRRAVRPGGFVLVAFHVEHLEHPGAEVVRIHDLWGHPIALDFRFLPTSTVLDAARTAGLDAEAVLERAPYAGSEAPTRRAYLLLRVR